MSKNAHVDLSVEQDEEETTAHARLDLRGDRFESFGKARRNPHDPAMPVIGEELAIARALGSLTAQVMEAAQDRIKTFLE